MLSILIHAYPHAYALLPTPPPHHPPSSSPHHPPHHFLHHPPLHPHTHCANTIISLPILFQTVSKMQENLTQEALVRCFQEKERYKGTSAFLAEVNRYNEAVYSSINGALTHTLLGSTPNYMSKLFALRFFKEVLVTANFSLIDQLDEEIEDHLVAVAQYNRKSRELNRGANYFIEVDKLKKDAEIQRIGSSYVLLAIEIVAVLAKWYPLDDDAKESRFADYAKQLAKNGVALPAGQYNFFKKEEEEKFRKNYTRWLQWYASHLKEQQQPAKATGKAVENKVEAVRPTVLEEIKEESSGLEALDLKERDLVSKVEVSHSKKDKGAQNAPSGTFRENQPIKGDLHNLDKDAAGGNCLNAVVNFQTTAVPPKEAESVWKSKQQPEEASKLQNQQKLSLQIQICRLRKQVGERSKQIQQLEKKLAEKDATIKELEDGSKQHEQLMKKKDDQLQALTKQKQCLLKELDDVSRKPAEVQKESECYNIVISPPLNIDELIDENQMLKDTIDILQESNNKTEQSLKQENAKLLALLREKEAEIHRLQNQPTNIENELIKNLIHEDSLVIRDQIKLQRPPAPNNSSSPQADPVQQKPDSLLRNCSVSQYLRSELKEISENQPPKLEARSRSLKKTQSQRKMRKAYELDRGFSQTGADFFPSPAAPPKLHKTVHNFAKSPVEGPSKFVTIYPFLDDYFPKLPESCPQFKSHCLQLLDSSKPYFQTESIKVALKVVSPERFIMGIQNRSGQDQKIKLVSGHYSIIIEGEKAKKIASMAAAEFDIKAVKIDLNLRYPVVSVLVGNHGISLTNPSSNDKVFHIPLPITLLNYCSFKNNRSAEVSAVRTDSRKMKLMSDRFVLSSSYSNIRECFPLLGFAHQERESVYRGVIECLLFEDAKVLLQIKENSREITLTAEFEAVSARSSDLGKVLLQVLTFLLKG